jgi:hypothetical protein
VAFASDDLLGKCESASGELGLPSSPRVSSPYPIPVRSRPQLSRAPFEQVDPGRGSRGVGIPGKKSVLSIGSIISEGV